MGRLEQKVAVVTGAGQGIGRAIALAFAGEGARLALANRTAATGEATARAIQEAGGEAVFVQTDVTRSADVRRLFETTADVFGGVDIVCCNAGVGFSKPLEEMSEEEWDLVLDTNLKSQFLCARHGVPHLKARGGGVIINFSSTLGFAALSDNTAYCASKAGVLGLTRALALELAPHNIRVNALAPGCTDTPQLWGGSGERGSAEARAGMAAAHPGGRFGTPEEIARAALWLASDEVPFMTGAALVVDGGMLVRFPMPHSDQDSGVV